MLIRQTMKKSKARASSSAARPGKAPSAPEKLAAPKLTGALIAALVLMVLILHLPREALTTDLDPSWGAVLDYAHGKGLEFGTDIVFTYGPLGYLGIQWFTGHGMVTRILFDLLLDFGIAAGVCLAAWRTNMIWRILLLGAFVLLPATIRPGVIDVQLEIGLFCWALLCFIESGPRMKYFIGILATFAVVCSLMKFTFMVMSLITIVALAANFALRGKGKLCWGLFIGFFAGSLGGWVLLGQNPLNLGAYLKGSLAISTGYESAMGLQFKDSIFITGVVTAILALAVAVIRLWAADEPGVMRSWLRRGVFIVWVFGVLFLAWKHGFVRAKSDYWAGFVALAALALEGVPVPSGRLGANWAARACAIACCALAFVMENWKEPKHFDNIVSREAAVVGSNTLALLNPPAYIRELNKSLDAERARAQLPKLHEAIGQGTVDVFGQNQTYALFNDFNYRPRPVFQSYSAYNTTLMDLNERAFASTAAPEFVLFNLGSIDGRFPPLEDARVLRTLLRDYALVNADGPFLLLKHQSVSAPLMTLLHEGPMRADEPINLEEYGDVDLWLEISMKASVEGRIREALYKPPEVYLAVRGKPGTQAMMFRAPATMLAAGFLVSPLLLRNQDAADLFKGSAIHRPGGFAIHWQTGTGEMWQQPIQYRIYRIDAKLGRDSPPEALPMK